MLFFLFIFVQFFEEYVMKMFFKRKNIVLLVIMLLCSLGMLAEEKTVALPEKPIVSRMILDNLFSYSSSYSRLIDE